MKFTDYLLKDFEGSDVCVNFTTNCVEIEKTKQSRKMFQFLIMSGFSNSLSI